MNQLQKQSLTSCRSGATHPARSFNFQTTHSHQDTSFRRHIFRSSSSNIAQLDRNLCWASWDLCWTKCQPITKTSAWDRWRACLSSWALENTNHVCLSKSLLGPVRPSTQARQDDFRWFHGWHTYRSTAEDLCRRCSLMFKTWFSLYLDRCLL